MTTAGLYGMDSELTAKAVVPAQKTSELPPGFYEMVDDLKSIVRGAHVRAQLKVNTEMLLMYWEIGRTILKRQGEEKWGTKVVNRIATELRTEFPNQRGFSRTNLHYMRQMARTWPDSLVQQAVGQVPWGTSSPSWTSAAPASSWTSTLSTPSTTAGPATTWAR